MTDTGRSLTAAGIGSVVYDGVEWVETSDAQSRILDNDDYGYSQTGWWDRSRSEGYLGDERFSNSGTGANVARWTAEGVTPGWYRVAATWVPGPNRATNAQFRVSYLDDVTGTKSPATTMLADGTAPNGIAPLNQRVLPASYAEDGTYWQELGDALDPQQALYFWIPDNSHTLVVELPDTGNAFVMADGVRLERLNGADLQTDLGFVPPPSYDFAREAEIRVVSQSDGRSLADGLGVEDFGLTDSHGTVVRTYAVQNTGLADLTVSVLNTVTQPVPAGFTATLSTNTIVPGGTATLTVTLQSATAGVFGGVLFLETTDRDENPFEITLMGAVSSAEPQLSADATVVDNDDDGATFSITEGTFRYQRRDTRFAEDDYRYARGGSNTVQWVLNFESAPVPRKVDLAANWPSGENRATNAAVPGIRQPGQPAVVVPGADGPERGVERL